MFVQMIILALDLHNSIMGEGTLISLIEPKTYNTLLHATMLIFVWLKFISILITHKKHGPTIRMIYRMGIESFLFFTVYIGSLIAASSVFAAIFANRTYTPAFNSFYESFKTLFAYSLGAFDLNIFFEDIRTFGQIMAGLFLLINMLILLKLLIAIYTDVYEKFVTRVDAEYNSNLINYYNRYRWNSKYGILILLPPPFTYLTLIFAPFVIFSRNPEKWNDIFGRIVFIIFAIPQFIIFAIETLFFIIPLWILSIYSWGKTGTMAYKPEQPIFHLEDEVEIVR